MNNEVIDRKRVREVVLQLLYQRDQCPDVPRELIEQFVRGRLKNGGLEPYELVVPCLAFYDGVLTRLREIDTLLRKASANWQLHRMTIIDRSVLRIGTYEILIGFYQQYRFTPIEEAVDLAKRYGSEKSPAFVNGVLDRVYQFTQASA